MFSYFHVYDFVQLNSSLYNLQNVEIATYLFSCLFIFTTSLFMIPRHGRCP
jgi:hypothetical protein